ncbi:hypothetical protein HMPREF1624_05872 [Sporothrix schenckii ATCC 58251]|uniref:LysM domain-containing protein n=1 Tax=Sporothrix schenckii (strain ATCC 58251 / de Perez 2211183) TaxID=1391915 RepID=U7PRX7_SPOS1|nr:hypothetical protein HMPREF1624_05872 [Sporothrix schenckii ATCC 58251]
MFSSSGVNTPDGEAAAARPRNRRPNAAVATGGASSSSSAASMTGGLLSPLSASRSYTNLHSGSSGSTFGGLQASSSAASAWVPNWSSIQEFATTLLAGSGSSSSGGGSIPRSRSTGARSPHGRGNVSTRKLPSAWGPAPPDKSSSPSRPSIQDVAAGQTAAREAELKARMTASVLESHPGVNGGLDVRGKFKKRNSDEILRGSAAAAEVEDCLVYIHRVQATDTYFGIILKYRCNEDAFRKANGLWSRDNIQIRKWVALPVDACEIKGRPCDDPSLFPQGVDLMASTPTPRNVPPPASQVNGVSDGDYFGSPAAGSSKTSVTGKSVADDVVSEPPWTHVRWVRLDSSPHPVEIVRMSRTTFGYFPPRRKKSIHGSVSSVSTPRASLDISLSNASLPERPLADSPNRSSRRPSLLGNRVAPGTSPISSSPSRHGLGRTSSNQPVGDPRPEWMRRPGGVGSMSRSVRAPGPARDSLNKWTTKHLPGLNIETLPSMSVMGSETAHFGFGDDQRASIVESSFEDGRDASTAAALKDNGLDKAAASIETWLRGAFAKRPGTPGSAAGTPSTSFAGRIGRQLEETLGDLIELEDGPREDGGPGGTATTSSSGQTLRPNVSTGWRTESEGSIRGRSAVAAAGRAKGKKDD